MPRPVRCPHGCKVRNVFPTFTDSEWRTFGAICAKQGIDKQDAVKRAIQDWIDANPLCAKGGK